jgi:hypothetical protein
MPTHLDIDYKKQLRGSVAPYSEHLLIHTGTSDWPSRIEDDARFPLALDLKAALKREIVKSLPARPANVLVSNSSFAKQGEVTVSLMKSGLHLGLREGQSVQELVDTILTPMPSRKLGSDDLKAAMATKFASSDITEVTVLICGHGARDERCGVMGSLLQDEFKETLSRSNIGVVEVPVNNKSSEQQSSSARVGLISHIGGHIFAGNVIIYIPKTKQYESHPLAGMGIWYGRVEPRHVEGITEKTIKHGVIIEELLRGTV